MKKWTEPARKGAAVCFALAITLAAAGLASCDMSLGDDDARGERSPGRVKDYKTCRGTFFRGDNWLNGSAGANNAGFTGGLWSAGAATAGTVYEASYTNSNTGNTLPVDATVVIEVAFDGRYAVITQTINGTKSLTIDTSNRAVYPLKVSSIGTLYVGLGGENTLNVLDVTVDGKSCGYPIKYGTFKPSAWNALAEFNAVELAAGQKAAFKFKQPANGNDTWKTWGLAIWGADVKE